MKRAYPEPKLDCTRPTGLTGLPYFAFVQDGSAGFVWWPGTFGDDPRTWGKIATTDDARSITLFDGPTNVGSGIMAVDAKGRLHVVQSTDVGADRRADTVTIFDLAGANVQALRARGRSPR